MYAFQKLWFNKTYLPQDNIMGNERITGLKQEFEGFLDFAIKTQYYSEEAGKCLLGRRRGYFSIK